jgi:hypothetical protein
MLTVVGLPNESEAVELIETFRNAIASESFAGGMASLISRVKSSLGLSATSFTMQKIETPTLL